MVRILPFVAALSLAFVPAAHAQPAPDEPVFAPEGVKAHVDFLADDLMEGRNAGTRGYALAARYVATRFEALGLVPGGPGGWYQQVPLVEYRLDSATASIGGKRFANGGEVLTGGSYRSENETVSGDTVFVSYGLEADYAGLDVKGKLVVALLGLPKGLSAEETAAAKAEDKLVTAARHGAEGVISLVTPEALKGAFRWDGAVNYAMRTRATWLAPDGAPAGEGGAVGLQLYVRGAAAKALFAGSPMSADQLYAMLSLPNARPKGFALAAKAGVTRNSEIRTFSSPNVIGVLPGSDPELARQYVILSAHLDHDGVNPELPGPDKIYNGAMDNAAGVATMLEVARGFVESGRRPRRSILFVALTAEEDGLLGSDYLAHYPVTGDGKPVADVNLDMPVLLYDFTDVVAFGAEHSTLGPIVARAAASAGVTLAADPLPEENLFVRSDHYSFVRQGVPSVFLMTGFANGGEAAFRRFLATTYHRPGDQPDQPGIDWAAGAKFARINYHIAREIADGDAPPLWYEGNPYGERFAPDAPKAKKPDKAP